MSNRFGTNVPFFMETPTDIRFYKSFGNMYVNMTYLYHDNQYDTTKIFWGWAAGSNHTSWNFQSAPINNHPSHFFADGTSPRLCYSPGATGSGSAVLYAGYNHSDLWIDAPWTLGIEEIPENVSLETFMVYPSVLRPYSTVFLVLPQDGIYNASISDITGRTVAEYSEITGVKGINSLEIGNLGAGVYFVEIYEPEKPSLKARITVL
ncbi:MAG: T9SS type A sorting domain-containing protein [Ignavibacteriales bacterium]|nr:T9SS type A sorting domain-containing protein [Ignavibacteriales bacterium]